MNTQISQSQNLKIWQSAWRFIGAQLVHTTLTVVILAGLLFGAARVGALNGLLAPLAQTTGSSFTTINYQGRLADSSGAPIDNTNPGVGMTFALYDVETGGTALWSEIHANVPVNEGLFSVKLGSINALSASLLSGDRWLGVRVGTDAEMTPREKLAAVPYAMIAGEALTVADGSVTSSKMAPSWYESFNPVKISTTSTTPVDTGVSVTFTCDTACTAFVLHRALVQHTSQDGAVYVRILANDSFIFGEVGVSNVESIRKLPWSRECRRRRIEQTPTNFRASCTSGCANYGAWSATPRCVRLPSAGLGTALRQVSDTLPGVLLPVAADV